MLRGLLLLCHQLVFIPGEWVLCSSRACIGLSPPSRSSSSSSQVWQQHRLTQLCPCCRHAQRNQSHGTVWAYGYVALRRPILSKSLRTPAYPYAKRKLHSFLVESSF